MQLHRLIQWGAYICSGVFLAFIAAITTGYKFWGLPPETWEGLDPYLYVCGFILFALQFFKFTRVVSWWALPVMGYLTFIFFDPNDNYGELLCQIVIAVFMSYFAFRLTYRSKPQH